MKLAVAVLVGSLIIHVVIGSGYDEGGSDSMCWKTTDYTLSSESKVLLTSCPTGLSIEFDVSGKWHMVLLFLLDYVSPNSPQSYLIKVYLNRLLSR